MPCYHPLQGYRSRTVGPSGRRGIVFNPHRAYDDMPMTVPCGQCIGCRLERSRQWAIRCLHEASLHEENCFLTLTYAPEHLPPNGSLRPADFTKFLKRLRRRIEPRRLRYFHAGEYGTDLRRPHYHAILFGWDFPDKQPWTTRNGFPTWRSTFLETLWPYGNSEIGTVTFESASYVARYVTKKVTGKNAPDFYAQLDTTSGELLVREPEYATMSRRPGIGKPWLDKYRCETFPADSVVVRGRLMQPPRYYLNQLANDDPTGAQAVFRARHAARDPRNESTRALAAREAIAKAKLALNPRPLENE